MVKLTNIKLNIVIGCSKNVVAGDVAHNFLYITIMF